MHVLSLICDCRGRFYPVLVITKGRRRSVITNPFFSSFTSWGILDEAGILTAARIGGPVIKVFLMPVRCCLCVFAPYRRYVFNCCWRGFCKCFLSVQILHPHVHFCILEFCTCAFFASVHFCIGAFFTHAFFTRAIFHPCIFASLPFCTCAFLHLCFLHP